MKYTINKKLMMINLIICLIIITIPIITNGVKIYITRTEIIDCANNSFTPCKMILQNGTRKTLQPGEQLIINPVNKTFMDTINYLIWASIITTLIINHLLYNKKWTLEKVDLN